MGGISTKNKATDNKPITISLLGLDNAGKTTIAKLLEKTSINSISPTINFTQNEIKYDNEKIILYDLPGGKIFRQTWYHYYDDPYGFIYVIDSSKENRLDENYQVLKQLLHEDKVKNKPILILANKQDKIEALDKNEILVNLNIEQLVNDNETLCRVELCTTKIFNSNRKNIQIDPSIQYGFDWLVKTIYNNYDILHKRVQQDIQKRNEAKQKIKWELQIPEEQANDDDNKSSTNNIFLLEQAIENTTIRTNTNNEL